MPFPASARSSSIPALGIRVQEGDVPVGWRLASATCSDGSPTTNITVVAGEAVTCTFLNVGDAYPRPKGASPITVSLVPAYTQCARRNRTHGPPLSFPSCNLPIMSSTSLTIGSPDANGAAANFTGSVRFAVVRTGGGGDDSDVAIAVSMADIRCRPGTVPCPLSNPADGPDYGGELRLTFTLRLTDRGAGDIPATVEDVPFSATIACAPTTAGASGGACPATTSADALIPGSVPEGERSIWQVGQVEIYDGGPGRHPWQPRQARKCSCVRESSSRRSASRRAVRMQSRRARNEDFERALAALDLVAVRARSQPDGAAGPDRACSRCTTRAVRSTAPSGISRSALIAAGRSRP